MNFLRKKPGTIVYFKKGWCRELLEVFNFYAVFFPTEESYLVSAWRWYQSEGRVRHFPSAMDFLDERVRHIRANLADPDTGRRTKLIEDGFLQVILNPLTQKELIKFLEKPAISIEDVKEVQRLMKRAWRASAEEEVVIAEPSAPENKESSSAGFPAKAYVIATQLHFELAGKEDEYAVVSRQVDQLARFIKDQFAAGELPRNFHKLKGYTYKPILNGKNTSKKGQLRPFFRQIAEHPEVFGEAVSGRAKTIFNDHFGD